MKTVLRYAGGKSRAYKIITDFLPTNTKKIISPFIGGGSLESRWSTELGIEVIGFDIFHHLINFWNILLNDNNGLADGLLKLNPNKETYESVKNKLLMWEETQKLFIQYKTDYYKRKPIKLSNMEGAIYYYFNHNLSYGPGFLGWMSKIYENKKKYYNMVERVRKYKNLKLSVYKESFENVIPEYCNDLIYLDPPYFLDNSNDNKMFKGMYPMSNFAFHHEGFDHEKLQKLLRKHKNYFILSYNNCKKIREMYDGYDFYYPSWNYSLGQGETRIGKNKINNKPKESHEILITNIKYDVSNKKSFDVFFK